MTIKRFIQLTALALASLGISYAEAQAQGKTEHSLPCEIKISPVYNITTKLTQWQYKQTDTEQWKDCTVPHLVQEELVQDKSRPMPYMGANENAVQWLSDKSWSYRTNFEVKELPKDSEALYLDFKGLDTYADIYLNGQKLGTTDNMFRRYQYDVSRAVQQGQNQLLVVLASPLKKAMPLYLSNGFNYPADNDHAEVHLSPFTRKAPYHYGWDWGMRLVTTGIHQAVSLNKYHHVKLNHLDIQSKIRWRGKKALSARLEITPEYERFSKEELTYRVTIREPKRLYIISEKKGKLSDNPIQIDIYQPQLWWTREWGKPNLYRVEYDLYDKEGNHIKGHSEEIGLRELKFINKPDEFGKSFYFELNKEVLFAKGANYVPNDQILTLRTEERFRRLFEDIAFANMNMVRVWGGGIYEDDLFYQLADENGILVWQDFMFACTPYPDDKAFLENVEQEAIQQLKRLRNHASLALWCGNNEVLEGLKYWGWQKRFDQKSYDRMWSSYKPLFEELLPRLVKAYSPQHSYIHGSPMQGNWGQKDSYRIGDSHYWGLWYGKEDFTTFEDKNLRFVSEFGFQAFPTMKTIRVFAEPKDYDLESEVMRVHQKASTGNKLIKTYMERAYPVPTKFEDFVYMNNVVQKEGMEYAMRTMRRQRPVCQGALYWQLNDSWASISWSGIDYYGNYKGLHYGAKEAFKPLNLSYSTDSTQNQLKVYLNNNLLQAQNQLKLSYQIVDFKGKELSPLRELSPKIQANDSKEFLSLPIDKALDGKAVLVLSLSNKDKLVDRLMYYAQPAKALDLPKSEYKISFHGLGDRFIDLKVEAKTLVKNLCLSSEIQGAVMSDNYFDMLPNESRIIRLHLPEQIMEFCGLSLKAQTLNSSEESLMISPR